MRPCVARHAEQVATGGITGCDVCFVEYTNAVVHKHERAFVLWIASKLPASLAAPIALPGINLCQHLFSAGGARLVLARMCRYSASLLNQESGFHQLVAEFNKGLGIPRASLTQEVAVVVADAMEAFSQVTVAPLARETRLRFRAVCDNRLLQCLLECIAVFLLIFCS